MFTEFDQQELNLLDILAVFAYLMAYENWIENRRQSAHNDVQAANAKQEKHILEEVHRLFDEQNSMLREILDFLRNSTTT